MSRSLYKGLQTYKHSSAQICRLPSNRIVNKHRNMNIDENSLSQINKI